jgi:acyl-CoA dehydrogenase
MNEFADPLDRLLADASAPNIVRAIEGGAPSALLWAAIESSGFLDALVPEAQGGAGLSLADVFPLLKLEGRHATPVPFGHTMLARAVLVGAGANAPAGSIAIAPSAQVGPAGEVICANASYGLIADWIIASLPGRWLLLPGAGAIRTASGIHGSLRADLQWPSESATDYKSHDPVRWNDIGAALAAARLAGAIEIILEKTVLFANERVQFGRAIGKFQAIQHQLAVMAEQSCAAGMSAEIGCHTQGIVPDPLRAALAKARTSEAAGIVAPMAHAIHGAIGVTAELDLQLFTRRIHEWRAEFGSETLWNRILGRALLSAHGPTLDFMRGALLPT